MEEIKILESWKEIASHLKRSVATCQRWEIELGLPVHRLDGTPRARVFAYPDELDRWKAEKLHSSEAALRAPDEPHRRKNRKAMAITVAVIAFAAIALLAWRPLLRKPILSRFSKKPTLAGKLESDSNLKPGLIALDNDIDLGPITSRSPEALKSYIEGCRELMWASGSDRFRTAISHFSKAIEIDPEFAMAYSDLAYAFYWASISLASTGSKEDYEKNLKKALELSDKVSSRERLMIQGNYYSTVEKNNEKAIQALKKSLKIYPDDDMANRRIASLYARVRDYKSAFMHRELLYKKRKTSRMEVLQYLSACMTVSSYDKAIEALKYYLDHAPEDADLRARLYNYYWQSGNYELALQEADRLAAAGEGRKVERIFPIYLMGDYAAAEQLCKDFAKQQEDEERAVWPARDWLQNIYITQGQLEKAKEQTILALHREEELVSSGKVTEYQGRCLLHLRLAELFLIEGKLAEAFDEAEKAWAVAADFKDELHQVSALVAKAEIYLEMKLFDKVQEIVEKIRELTKSFTGAVQMSDHYYLSGKIELENGHFPVAIDYFKKIQSLYLRRPAYMPIHYIAALALAYYQAGNLHAARKECEKIPLSIEGRMLRGYIYALNFYRLGKICEEQREPAKAIENYGKFLEIWKNADPIFPEVEEAKTRLARLVSR